MGKSTKATSRDAGFGVTYTDGRGRRVAFTSRGRAAIILAGALALLASSCDHFFNGQDVGHHHDTGAASSQEAE